jgi:acetyl esterase/lipase
MTQRMLAGMTLMIVACSAPSADGVVRRPDRPAEAVAVTRRCRPDRVASADVRVAREVPYVTRDGRPLHVDVAWSEGGPPAPLVLLLHGGSWSGGVRGSLDAELVALARRGYTAATVEYRLTEAPRDVFPAAAADVRCALRVLRARAGDFHIAAGRAAVMGYSAGGHLASLLGVAPDVAELGRGTCDAGGDEVRVQAVVSYAGPQDLRVNAVNEGYTREQAELVTNFLGVFPGDDPRLATLASPVAHIGRGAPPFLLLHGTDDPLVPLRHAHEMARTLRSVGTPATVLELAGVGHGFVGMLASRDDRVRCTVDAFLSRWLERG